MVYASRILHGVVRGLKQTKRDFETAAAYVHGGMNAMNADDRLAAG